MKYGLTAATISKIHDILASYPQVKKAIIYGSRAVGSHRVGSDIDNPKLIEHIEAVGKVFYERKS